MGDVVPIADTKTKRQRECCPECGYRLPHYVEIVNHVDFPLVMRVQCPDCSGWFLWTLEIEPPTKPELKMP